MIDPLLLEDFIQTYNMHVVDLSVQSPWTLEMALCFYFLCNLLFVLIGHFGLVKEANNSFFLHTMFVSYRLKLSFQIMLKQV